MKEKIDNQQAIHAAESKAAIIGTFEGECADSNITNLNGLDITRQVWETVFNSDEYKNAIANRWYIGFLGHPEDSNCMDFRNACIVMTEGHIADNGKVYGKFDLVDTPVGRVVKTFIDAGVTFGISVRGAGDIINNSVDPETFVFRGFDLVAFPAFPESIPTFTAIAASSDADTRAKYKKICAAVDDNVEEIDAVEAIDVIASHFGKQSDTYAKLQSRKAEILLEDEETASNDDLKAQIAVLRQKVEAMTQLFMQSSEVARVLASEVNDLTTINAEYKRKFNSLRRITSAQQSDLTSGLDAVTASCETLRAANVRLKDENASIQKLNLKYKQNIDASSNSLKERDAVIAQLNAKISETVTASNALKRRSSNLDETNAELSSKLTAATELIQKYQDAYAQLYAHALGVELTGINVTASTSVSEIQSMIRGNIGRNRRQSVTSATVPEDLTIIDAEDDGLVTL